MRKVTQSDFKVIKGGIFWKLKPSQAAAKYDLSLKTVLQIRGSHDYTQYQEQNKAQHPEIQYSLREHVLDLHKRVFNDHSNTYIAPNTARRAVLELQLKFKES